MSRRGTGCLVIVLVLLVIVCGVSVAVDRAAASAAEGQLADAVDDNLASQNATAGSTSVDLEGFPFLTQVLSGEFDGAKIHLTKVVSQGTTVDKVDLDIRDVKVPRDVLTGGSPHDITAGSIRGTGRISVAEVARRVQLPGLTITSADKALRASIPVTVAILGKITVQADVTPKLTGNSLTFTVANVKAAGVDVPQSVVADVTDKFGREIVLDLPLDVKLDSVTASGGFVTVAGSASHVQLVD